MSRFTGIIAPALILVLSLPIAPNALQAQHRGGGGFSGGAARGGVAVAPHAGTVAPRTGNVFPGRPASPVVPPVVSPVIRPPGNSFSPGIRSGGAFVRPGAPFSRHRNVIVSPGFGLGFGGYGFGLGYPYYSPFYPGYADPFYTAPAYSEPYSEPAYVPPAAPEPVGPSQSELELSYQVGQLSQQIEQLRQQQAQPPRPVAPEPMPMPTVLVFRDGHRIEIQNYAIVGQTLWVLDQRNSTKIPVADLDVDATQKENRVRGLRFQLP